MARRAREVYEWSMSRLIALARRYPLVTATLAIALVGMVLCFTPAAPAVPWILGVFALAVAAREAWSMVRRLMGGQVGLDILAVTAIVATVLVGEYWAGIVIVLAAAFYVRRRV